ncbi:protein LYK5 [Euphorbia lathyris]|uniref:protein LYK5 n=1 Tax=Euphorbia lathyris TaxID=212925 RepID=UPI0033131D2B
MASISIWTLMVIAVVFFFPNKSHLHAQQSYVNNKQLDCYNTAFNSITEGFQCNAVQSSSCQSYLTFRSSPPYYVTPVSISYLLGAQDSTSLLVSINNISSDVASIPADTQVIVPVNCSCYNNQYYQHNASYTLKFALETYFSVANNTYQGLSTCQALMDQNPIGDRNMTVGQQLHVPLRCACPTSNQTSLGFNYLVTYMVTWGDTLSSIARLFGVDLQNLLEANELSSTSIIFPFTPILVPLTTKPTNFSPAVESPPAAAPPPQISVAPPPDSNSSSNKFVFVGVGLGIAALIGFCLFGFLFWYRRSAKSHRPVPISAPIGPKTVQSESVAIPDSNSWSLSSDGVRYAIESLTVYKYSDLQMATGYFSKDNIIKGSVYKGNFKGDGAAIKVMKGDVSSEINILKKLNHSSIIRLSGFCVHQDNTYLVYEYAENGDLSDKIHTLPWKQRVQIAHDVADALNYLHNYTNPPYIHKNLKTSNILLDANMRAKVSNFGLARSVDNEEEGGLQLTRHVIGTQGYMAPEYIENGVITPKLDVFSFGVVILELLSGKEAASDRKSAEEEMLSATIIRVLEGDNVRQKFCEFMDNSLGNEYPMDLAFSLAQLAETCVAVDINARPPIAQVRMTLSKILSSSIDWDPSLELNSSTTSIGSGR